MGGEEGAEAGTHTRPSAPDTRGQQEDKHTHMHIKQIAPPIH